MHEITDTEVHKLLVKARVIQSECGHTQRSLMGSDGTVCARGAVLAAITGNPRGRRTCLGTATWRERGTRDRALLQACERAMGFPEGLPGWNDQVGRTLADVLQRFDRGIAATKPVTLPHPRETTPRATQGHQTQDAKTPDVFPADWADRPRERPLTPVGLR